MNSSTTAKTNNANNTTTFPCPVPGCQIRPFAHSPSVFRHLRGQHHIPLPKRAGGVSIAEYNCQCIAIFRQHADANADVRFFGAERLPPPPRPQGYQQQEHQQQQEQQRQPQQQKQQKQQHFWSGRRRSGGNDPPTPQQNVGASNDGCASDGSMASAMATMPSPAPQQVNDTTAATSLRVPPNGVGGGAYYSSTQQLTPWSPKSCSAGAFRPLEPWW